MNTDIDDDDGDGDDDDDNDGDDDTCCDTYVSNAVKPLCSFLLSSELIR